MEPQARVRYLLALAVLVALPATAQQSSPHTVETPYCAGCDELHGDGLGRAEIRKLLERFDVYRLGFGERRSATVTWAGALGVSYTPTIVLFDGGKEVFRIEAYVRPFHLEAALDYIASGAYRKEPSFQRYLQARAKRLRRRGEQVELWN